MGENGHSSEGVLESIERMSTVLREIPRSIFPGELGERDHNVQVVEYKPVVEVGKPQEGLDVLETTLRANNPKNYHTSRL